MSMENVVKKSLWMAEMQPRTLPESLQRLTLAGGRGSLPLKRSGALKLQELTMQESTISEERTLQEWTMTEY